MNIEILEGAQALQRLRDPQFQAHWSELAQACPWATSFQQPAFVLPWFDAYAPVATPVVLYAGYPGSLEALLILALDPDTGALSIAGAHQAEYQAWLCRPGASGLFLKAALDVVAERFSARALRFRYVPASREVEGLLDPACEIARQVTCREHKRPLLLLGDGTGIEASLRKKSNKSKLSRLRRRGDVAVRVLGTRSDLEACMDQIAAIYDLRQSAANGVAPFLEDPRKRDFHLRLMEAGLLHAATLSVDEEVVAAILSIKDGKSLAVGVFAISAKMAAESPGKMLLLLLGQRLAGEGYEQIDLTPGGEWKDRFATDFDTVLELTFHTRPATAAWERHRQRVLDQAKGVLVRAGLAPARLRGWSKALSPGRMMARVNGFRSRIEYALWILDSLPETAPTEAPRLQSARVDAVACPRPSKNSSSILTESFDRFERGWECLAHRDGPFLDRVIWFRTAADGERHEMAGAEVPTPQGAWLADLTWHRRYDSLRAPNLSDVEHFARAAGSAAGGGAVYAVTMVQDEALECSLRAVGFKPFGRVREARPARPSTPRGPRDAANE